MAHDHARGVSRFGAVFVTALGISALAPLGCNGGTGITPYDGGPPDAGACTPDPLKTGLPALFNGNTPDMYDCPVLAMTAKYNEPDAMIFKAIMYVESRFQYDAVGCTSNSGCCPQSNWTNAECACLGVMQSGPTCGGTSTLGLLPDGHPDLETDPNASDFANSCFNPWVAIELGVSGIAYNRTQEKQKFPGCTEDQYTLMAIGDFNSYGSTKSCTVYNTTYDTAVLDAYKQYSAASGWPAHPY